MTKPSTSTLDDLVLPLPLHELDHHTAGFDANTAAHRSLRWSPRGLELAGDPIDASTHVPLSIEACPRCGFAAVYPRQQPLRCMRCGVGFLPD